MDLLVDGRYLLLDTLGRGGMGTVFRAFDRRKGRQVALKVLRERGRPGPGHPLAAEFAAWARLRHPNVVQALALGRTRTGPWAPSTPYLVLEHVPGAPVHRALPAGKVGPALLREVARRVLRGLAHVHAGGLVHRDVKPGNVLVVAAGRGAPRVKLTDFGLAVRAGTAGRPGLLSGSIAYVSPEAIRGRPLDGRADLYALGLLLRFLATGSLPSATGDPEAALRWHLSGEDAPPAGLPPRLARFVQRLTRREPDERYASARHALAELEERPVPVSPLRPALGTADLLALRLAVDAARLGARREITLPASRGRAAALVREASVLAQLHGLGFHARPRRALPAGRPAVVVVDGNVPVPGPAGGLVVLRASPRERRRGALPAPPLPPRGEGLLEMPC